MEKETKEAREALEQIRKIYREERMDDLAARAKSYLDGIRALNENIPESKEVQDAVALATRDFAGCTWEMAKDMHSVAVRTDRIAAEYLERPEFQAHTPTEEELRDIYREKRTNVTEPEDKQHILDLLVPALQATRHLENLAILNYDAETECVKAFFSSEYGGCVKTVNVACDSGIAMIRDVLGGLG